MKDFKKLFKLQWKKNAIWLILLIIGSLLINTLTFKSYTKDIYRGLTNSVESFEESLDIKKDKRIKKPKEIDKSYIEYGDKLRDKLVEKYGIIPNEELMSMETDEIDKYYAKDRSMEFNTIDSKVANYDVRRDQLLNGNSENNLFSQYTNFFIFPFLFILAMLLTSIEQMTNYFDFTRMYPWSKTKDFAMKLVFGLLLTLVVYLLHIGIEQVMMKTSGLAKLYTSSGLARFFVKELILYWIFFVIFLSTGAMSGNIFGHFGLNIIAFGLFELSVFDISTIQTVINGLDYGPTIMTGFDEFLAKQEGVLLYLLSPLRDFNLSNEMLIAHGIIAALVFILAYFIVKHMKTENSGYMVINRPLKIFSQTLASLTLTALIFNIVTSTFVDYNVYIGIVLYLFLLFVSYKLFKALFNIKIKV
ncbi:MAG: hypothetical protein SOW41_00500 [Anaerococcus sp.]|nr:hypothetical protein [Peptoniphilaceae bacterium]MDY3054520.1 hypothetical protein [Anaerococcus sp.]